MTRRELIDLCLCFPAAYEDYPFHDFGEPGAWAVMRHRGNRKTFATVYERGGRLCLNVKCEPMEADFLRQVYVDILPGYHMNKVHWNTILLGGDVPDEALQPLIAASYALICPRKTHKPPAPQDEPT